jgi:hypothetical protein
MWIRFGDPATFSISVECNHSDRGALVVTESGRAFGDADRSISLSEAAGWWLRDLSVHRGLAPLVLRDPFGGASIEAGHPAATRAVVLAFSEWVRRGCAPDAEELVALAHFEQRAALIQGPDRYGSVRLPHELLRGWECVVTASEHEQIEDPDGFSDDLQIRDAIQRVLDAMPSNDPHVVTFAADCAAFDERFRALLAPVDSSSSEPWWRASLPRLRAKP